jgi:transposase InsO family protein
VSHTTRNALQRFQEQKIETLFGSLKVERLHDMHFETRRQAQHEVIDWLAFYNSRRPHSSLDRQTPDQAYFTPLPQSAAA